MARNNIFNQPKQNTPKQNTKSQAKSILDSKAVNDLVKTSKSNRQNTTSDSIGNRSDNNSTTDSNPYKHPIVKDNRVINIQNLRPVTTKEEARERGRQGGLKSGAKAKARKTMRETILSMLSQELSPEQIENYGIDISTLNGDYTMQSAVIAAMLREAMNGSEKAMQLLRDTIGEQPTVKQEISQEIVTKEDKQAMENLRRALTG